MRGVLFIGMVVVLLIVGVLVIGNMGSDRAGGDSATQAESYIEKAESAAAAVDQKVSDIHRKVGATE